MAKKVYEVKNFVRMDTVYLQSFKIEAENMQEAMEIAWMREQWEPYYVQEMLEDRLHKYLDYEESETFILQKKDQKENNFENYNKTITKLLRGFVQADQQDNQKKHQESIKKFIWVIK